MRPGSHGDPEIRRALRRSLAVVAVLAGLIVFGVWWSRRGTPPPAADPSPVVPAVEQGEATLAKPRGFVFRDRARERGVDFVHVNGATGRKLLPETLGGGVAIADLDGDGDPDLVFVDGDRWADGPADSPSGRGIAVYLNDGRGFFSQPVSPTGLEEPFQGMGIAVGDVDGDGDLDLLVTSVSGVRLFLNESADGRIAFRDRTIESGLADLDGWSTAAGFGDLDADGDLDLVVAHYVEWNPDLDAAVDYQLAGVGRAYGPPLGFAGETVRVFFNDGDGAFVDRTVEAGFDVRNPATGEPMAKALGLLVQDLDGDGDLDVFVANDTVANLLFVNAGDGTFREMGAAAGVAFDRSGAATGAMGVDLARLEDSGGERRAIAVGNFANEPTSLYASVATVAGATPRFADDAIPLGISAATRPALTFGVVWADLDGDGVEELVSANGHLEEAIARFQASQTYRQSAQVFAFEVAATGGRLREVPPQALGDLATPVVGRGLAWGDLDLDGDLDLVITQIAGAPLVLFNETREAMRSDAAGESASATPHWIRLVPVGPRGDASVVGATVRVTAGGRTIVREVAPTRSYLSQVERPLTIGLGDAVVVDRIEVEWAGGGRTVLENVPVDGTVLVGDADLPTRAEPSDSAARDDEPSGVPSKPVAD